MSDEVKISFRDRVLMNVPLKQKMLLAFYGCLIALLVQTYLVWSVTQESKQLILNEALHGAVNLAEITQQKANLSIVDLQAILNAAASESVSVSITQGNINDGNSAAKPSIQQYIAPLDQTVLVSLNNADTLLINKLLDYTLINSAIFIIIVYILASSVSANLLPLIAYIIEVMQVISSGNLERKVGFSGDDEFGQLGGAIDGTIGNIRNLLNVISKSVITLNKTTKNIEEQSGGALQAVNKQHEQIDMVATAISQLSLSIQELAQNSSNADKLTTESNVQAQQAKSRVNQTINSITSLSKSINDASGAVKDLEVNSQMIGKVVAVIQGISEQTNLLALNAAIEAARAGDQGRGFAVVADEVRQLAQRTQDSTIEIQSMIEALQSGSTQVVSFMEKSVKYADSGVEQVNEFVIDIESIVENVHSLASMNELISGSLQAQSEVTQSIDTNVQTIREISTLNLDTIQITLEGNEHTTETANELTAVLKNYHT